MANNSKIRSYSFGFFRKLFIFLYNIRCKRILKRLIYNTSLAEKILIDNFNERYPDKAHDFKAKLAFLVIRKLFNVPIPDSHKKFLSQNSKIIDSEVALAKQIESIRKRRIRYLEYLKYYFEGSIDYIPEDYPNRSEIISEKIPLISSSEFNKRTQDDLKEYKSERKELIKQLKIERARERIEKVPKIEVTSQSIATVITLFSVLFLVTGFLYNQLFLGYFGIDLSNFFSMGDYLSSSASKIYYSLLSLFAAVILGLFLWPEYLYGEVPERPKSKTARRLDDLIFYSLVPLSGIITIQGYFSKNFHQFNFGLEMFLFFSVLHFIPRIIIFFKNPIRSYFVILSILLFLGSITFGAIDDVNKVLSLEVKDLKRYKIVFDEKSNFNDENLILLSSTNNYYIFFDKKESVTKVIPSNRIISIEPLSDKKEREIYKYLIKPFLK